ncbi:hypothetical protein QYE76_059561 [Lolium multiflorum]|uniref:MYB transcription factor n=1 Tax=Lolium multiflorum TaxID=4521 RepID=A0AAD8RY77_LOLMU|nr:hypothetical protein QYE76_059561 [Lolium multiflorum]
MGRSWGYEPTLLGSATTPQTPPPLNRCSRSCASEVGLKNCAGQITHHASPSPPRLDFSSPPFSLILIRPLCPTRRRPRRAAAPPQLPLTRAPRGGRRPRPASSRSPLPAVREPLLVHEIRRPLIRLAEVGEALSSRPRARERMGAPKQKWTAEEEAALKAGISKHGTGKWRTILKDPEFSSILRYRSNVDLKDKWRNMNVTVNASGSREKVRATPTPAFKKLRSAPKQESTSASAAAIVPVASDGDDEMPEAAPIAAISAPGKSLSRLENIIVLEAVKTLNEPTGSYKTAIANYIEVTHCITSYLEKASIDLCGTATNVCIPGQRESSFCLSQAASDVNFLWDLQVPIRNLIAPVQEKACWNL